MNTPTRSQIVVLLIFTSVLLAMLGIPTVSADDSSDSEDDTNNTVPGPDYDIPPDVFYTLWAGYEYNFEDRDDELPSEYIQEIVSESDWEFESPPADPVHTWNSNTHENFESGDSSESIAPKNTSTSDSTYIKDAYIQIFSISPSTKTHSEDGVTQYISESGEVRSILDYRLSTPSVTQTNDGEREEWNVQSHRVENVSLSINGSQEDSQQNTHTPALEYTNLSGEVELTVTAEISTSVRKLTQEDVNQCDEEDVDCEPDWETTETGTQTDSITVEDTETVTVESLSATGKTVQQLRYGSTLTGYSIHTHAMWDRITVDSETIQSPWRFYSTSSSDWGVMESKTRTGSTTQHSSTQPLQIYAFPTDRSPRTDASEATIINQSGTEKTVPTMPSNIDVAAAESTYTTIEQLVFEMPRDTSTSSVSVHGLVEGNTATADLNTIELRETFLSTTVVDEEDNEITIQVQVTDKYTGVPVSTGTVQIEDAVVGLDSQGTATATVDRPAVEASISYSPLPWWMTSLDPDGNAYLGNSTGVVTATQFPAFAQLANIFVATLFWVVPLFLLIYAMNLMTNGSLFNQGE